jgi:hypothetical protein
MTDGSDRFCRKQSSCSKRPTGRGASSSSSVTPKAANFKSRDNCFISLEDIELDSPISPICSHARGERSSAARIESHDKHNYSARYQKLKQERKVLHDKIGESPMRYKSIRYKEDIKPEPSTVFRTRSSSSTRSSWTQLLTLLTSDLRQPSESNSSLEDEARMKNDIQEKGDGVKLRSNALILIQSIIRRYLTKKLVKEEKAVLIIGRLFRHSKTIKDLQVERQKRMAHVNTMLRAIKRREAEHLIFKRRELYTIHEGFAESSEEESKADWPW